MRRPDRFHHPGAVILLVGLLFLLQAFSASALPAKLGDLDEDGVATILDVAKLAAHFRGTHSLAAEVALFADMNQDGALNEADQDALVGEILLLSSPRDLPLTSIREVSPARGEADVAVNRETIIHFAHPLSPLTTIDTTRFHADFGGRKILSSVQLALDGKKATLFYLEPLPSNARVIVTFDGNGLNDLIGRPIDADGDGQPGGVFNTEFETISTQPVPNTGVVGIVYASERGTGGAEVPLAGVTITVDGAEETLRAVTGPNGAFTLNPCPSGTFFVHIDGRTASASSYPAGAYYPSVGKKWFTVPGRIDNPAGDLDDMPAGGGTGVIYLPCICAGTLNTVSPVQDTIITFPASVLAANPTLAGTEIRVPANSLFADDGTRGGKVGIAPVAPDRLPSPLPPGLNPPIVFTVQSDGATNFDQPVPVCLPNLPDPVTGKKLEPGAKSALFSFNHDLGEWEIAGSMTVSEDGNSVTTDVGVGIRQPGWHVSQPGVLITGNFAPSGCHTNDALEHALSDLSLAAVNGTVVAEHSLEFTRRAQLFSGHFIREIAPPLALSQCMIKAMANATKEGRDFIGTDLINLSCLEASLLLIQPLAHLWPPAALVVDAAIIGIGLYGVMDELFDASGHFVEAYSGPVAECDPDAASKAAAIQSAVSATRSAGTALAAEFQDALQYDATDYLPALSEIEGMINGNPTVSVSAVQRAVEGVQAIEAYVYRVPRMAEKLEVLEGALKNLTRKIEALDDILMNPNSKGLAGNVTYSSGVFGRLSGLSFSVIAPADTVVSFKGVAHDGFLVGSAYTAGGPSGSRINLGRKPLRRPHASLDSDFDGVPDIAEEILGSDPLESDTDGDGISDAQEILTNSGSAAGLPTFSGSAAQTKVATSAYDVSASSRTLAVACGGQGTAFLATQGIAAPVMRTRVPTSSLSSAVSMGANVALVAEAEAGFRCVSLDDQLNVNFTTLLPVPGRAVSAVASGEIGYGGTSGGAILELDLASGGLLRQLETGAGEIEDLAVQGDWLFARKPDRLLAVPLNNTAMTVAGQLVLSSGRTPSPNRLRIALAEGRVFCTKGDGCQIVNTANLPTLSLAGTVPGPGDDWRHFVPNGRLGILAGKVATGGAALDIPRPASLFTIPAAGNTAAFATSFDMPGRARALALNRALAFVVCDNGTLAVVNYLDFDRLRVPPTIALSSDVNLAAGLPTAVEGSPMRLSANVTDDVQVGNVEFYVDGVLGFDDGTYPFEHRFLVSRRSVTKTTFKVKARAVDTGGNATWSTEYTITMLPDTLPPTARSLLPAANSMNRTVTNAYVRFSELMDPTTLVPPALALMEAGTDALFDTGDDVPVSYSLVYRDEDSLARLALNSPLAPGLYRLRAAAPVADATGNAMTAAAESVFRVYSLTDTDNDGIPDDWELLLGTNPNVTDSNGNGVADGLEDRDADGTPDGVEITRLDQDPRVADMNLNGIADGLEDSDGDNYLDGEEAVAGTNVFNSDTDGDGLDDATEAAAGLNPLVFTAPPTLTSASALVNLLNASREITPVIAIPVQSSGISLLQALPEIAPIIPTPVLSGPTSFKNNPPSP